MKNIVFALTLMLILTAVGCTEESTPAPDPDPTPDPVSNPLNFVGEEHNSLLDFIAKDPGFQTASEKDIHQIASQFEFKVFGQVETAYPLVKKTMDQARQIAYQEAKLLSSLPPEPEWSAKEKSYLKKLENIFLEAADEGTQQYKSVEEFTKEIETLEADILAKLSLEYDEKKFEGNTTSILLGACAVAKHSYAFWIEAATDPAHPWHNKLDNTGSRGIFQKIWGAIKKAAVDTWSFITAPCWRLPDINTGDPGGFDIKCGGGYASEASAAVN
jgi:hypothetical protein